MWAQVRGGAPLHHLEAECPAHLHTEIFGQPGARREVITWHRIKDVRAFALLPSRQLHLPQPLTSCFPSTPPSTRTAPFQRNLLPEPRQKTSALTPPNLTTVRCPTALNRSSSS